MDNYDWRCINCGEFHEYGQWQCYDQGWENQPRASWQGEDDFNPWNPSIHQYYGEYEYQPYEQEQPRKKSLEDLLEDFMIESEKSYRRQEEPPHQSGKRNLEDTVNNLELSVASFIEESRNDQREREARTKNVDILIQKISKQNSDESQSSFQSDTLISSAERYKELQIEEEGDHT